MTWGRALRVWLGRAGLLAWLGAAPALLLAAPVDVTALATPAWAAGLIGQIQADPAPVSPARVGVQAPTAEIDEPADLHSRVLEALKHTHQPRFLPDALFAAAHAVASGPATSDASAYARYLAQYLTSTGFSCRHPVYARYFQARYGAAPAEPACERRLPFLAVDRDAGMAVRWLDLDRVRGIELLFGGQGQAWASRFGHVALRVVVCPKVTSTTRQCDENLAEHLVLGYLAGVDTLDIDALRGMFGGYPATLNANAFMNVYREYAINEFREIYSLPLQLAATRQRQVLRELSEVHWQYVDQYWFATNNCATMLQQALRVMAPELFAADAPGPRARPDQFFDDLRRSSAVDRAALADLAQAERDGHYFSSTRPFFDLATTELRRAMSAPWFSTMDEYLGVPAASRHAASQADAPLLARLATDQHLREAQLMLEELGVMRISRRLMSQAAHYFDDPELLGQLQAHQPEIDPALYALMQRCIVEPIRRMKEPTPRRAGIPAPGEALPGAQASFPATCGLTLQAPAIVQLLAHLHPGGQAAWGEVVASAHELNSSIDTVGWIKALARD
jgi:Domain of unknown function (DUF4105)